MRKHHNILIVGAGLSGLYLAWHLSQAKRDVLVLETRSRPGGRILSLDYDQRGCVDMGPAWIWPAFQPRMQRLLTQLALPVFPQFISGDLLFEAPTQTTRHPGPSAHNESYRLAGGNQRVIDALREKLPPDCLQLNTRVTAIAQDALHVTAMRDNTPIEYSAETIVLALPPRIAQQAIRFSPALPADVLAGWRALPTWMAVHSKMLFLYDTPFWREQGLSGEVFSQVGPLSEIYDGSPADEAVFALTSFVGIGPSQRQQLGTQQLIEASLAQLQRLFGEQSRQPLDILIQDWSQDPATTTDLDLSGPFHHPEYPAQLPRSFWNKRLLLAGTEVAPEHAGYLEGALASADQVLSQLGLNPRI